MARALGDGATRNAVIGKVHRLGLGGRERPSAPAERRASRARGKTRVKRKLITKPTRAFPLASVTVAPAVGEAIVAGSATLLTLTAHACRWPFGDPLSDRFSFCGRAAVRGAYCAGHASLAFRPPQEQPRPDRLLRLAAIG